ICGWSCTLRDCIQARVQSPIRGPTAMGFWAKSLRIFNAIRANGPQSVRRLATRTGLSKSSVHRHTQAMERRDRHPESWLWETEEGRSWLGSVAKFDFWGKIQKSGIRNSITYRLTNSRKSNFATEPMHDLVIGLFINRYEFG